MNDPTHGCVKATRLDARKLGYQVALVRERAFPYYLQAGPSFFIEKSKRKMIAKDLSAAQSG
jgi:nicotinamidase-related amidase